MTKIIVHPSGREISYDEGDTVLSCLEKNGLALPNNCRAGACGECKVKVLSGEYDQGFILDMALSPDDREQGFGLMCMAKPKSEVLEIEWETHGNLPKLTPPREDVYHILTEKLLVTDKIVRLKLRPLKEGLRFWPGQYVTLGSSDDGIPARSYSIANIPNNDGEIVLYITKVEEGKASSWVHQSLQEGDMVKVSGPYGTFIGDPTAERSVLCLAAGSGLAPIMSLASAALQRGGFRYPATIIYSSKTADEVFAKGHFKYLETKYRNFKFKTTTTQENNPNGYTGRIPDILSHDFPNLYDYSIYIAGSPDFVDDCKRKVLELNAQEEFIHTEGFFSQDI